MDDIRIKRDFISHRKTQKLISRCGLEGFYSLISLWARMAVCRPKGILYDMSDEDIAIEAQWKGEPEKLINALLEIGWLDRRDDGILLLHDWKEHQSWVYGFEERSAKAKQSIQARWNKRLGNASNITPIRTVYEPNTEGNTPLLSSPFPSSPFPSLPKDLTTIGSRSEKQKDLSPVLFRIPLLGDKEKYELTENKVKELQETYPAVDVMQQLRELRQWNIDNPKHRKTRSGILKHVNWWLGNKQNKARKDITVPEVEGSVSKLEKIFKERKKDDRE